MANLVNHSAKLKINKKPGVEGIYHVTTSVKLRLNADDAARFKAGAALIVRGFLMSQDGGANGDDDRLAKMGGKKFAGAAVECGDIPISFTKDVAASLLDEDSGVFQGDLDEVYARFNLHFLPIAQSSLSLLIDHEDSKVKVGHAESGQPFA